MKISLLKELRKEFSSDFTIQEDLEREFGCMYKVTSPYCVTYHAMSIESAKEYIQEKIRERIKAYIEEKRPKSKRYDVNGNEIEIPKRKKKYNIFKRWINNIIKI